MGAEVISVAAVAVILLLLCLVLPIATQSVTDAWYLANNQYIIGPVVNASLIYAGLRFKNIYNAAGIVLIPSLSAACLGLIGINAVFMLYMVPFIWLGNMAIMLTFRLAFRKGDVNTRSVKRYPLTAVLGVTFKVALVFGGFFVLQSFNVFPSLLAEKLWTMMGIVQLITASCGAVIAYGAVKLFARNNKTV